MYDYTIMGEMLIQMTTYVWVRNTKNTFQEKKTNVSKGLNSYACIFMTCKFSLLVTGSITDRKWNFRLNKLEANRIRFNVEKLFFG